MYLRDLQLDIPYNEKPEMINEVMCQYNCTYEEAIKIDYDRNWKWNIRRRFLLETNCIVSMFLRLLGGYKNKDCKKIVVRCVEKLTRNKGFDSLGIYFIELIVNHEEFFLKDDNHKKQFALNIIKQSIEMVAQEKEWDISPFEEVFNKIIELDYQNHWTWRKKINNPSRRYTSEVYLEHEIENIKIYILIRNKQGKIMKKQLIITELPDEYAYWGYLGKLKWLSNNEVQLVNKNNMQWTVQLEL